MKRLSSLFAFVIICIGQMFAYSFEVDGIYYDLDYNYKDGTTGAKVSYLTANTYSGNVVIPHTVDYGEKTYDVRRIGSSAFAGCASLTSVTIPSSVTVIENSAFSGCSSLSAITFPNSITSIEAGAFSGCSSLTSVTIPEGVASIESSTFSGCSSLTSVTIPNSVTNIGGSAFSDCI